MPRRPALRALAAAGLLMLTAVTALSAQKTPDISRTPPRPIVTAASDTNDANTYLANGSMLLKRDPATAAAHFYWAMRLRPDLPQAMYGRWVAVRLANLNRLISEGRAGKRQSTTLDWSDSLLHRALMIDPLLHRNLERELTLQGFAQYRRDVEEAITETLRTGRVPWLSSDIAYTEGRFGEARKWIDRAIDREEGEDGKNILLTDKGHILYHLGHADSALAAFDKALGNARAAEKKRTGWLFYASKAQLEHARARILLEQGRAADAREAFGRALQEDLSIFAAHMHLAEMALAEKDTAAAVSESALAAEIAKENAAVQYGHATLLLRVRKPIEAVAALQAAIAAEPLYAEPYFLYGRLAEASGDVVLAMQHYRSFLNVATRADERRPWVTQRLESLVAQQGPAGGGH